jgi:hypothetical protein
MEQGLWTAIFSSGSLAGGGVVYLSGGKLVGGDSQFYWVGSYQFDPSTKHLEASATVLPFVAGAISIFGIAVPQYELRLSGILASNEASIVGLLPAMPSVRMNVKLVKRLEKAF